ncbi:MAG: DsrE family protein [Isosphaeraceae bacterium]
MKPLRLHMCSRMGNTGSSIAMLAIAAFGLVAAARGADDPARGAEPLRVVVHVNFSDSGQQGRGLENIENILKAASSAGIRTEVEVVCHAQGIDLVHRKQSAHPALVEGLRKQGVRFVACQNTMRKRSMQKDDLLPGVTTVPSGAFEIVVRQRDGYSYFKP